MKCEKMVFGAEVYEAYVFTFFLNPFTVTKTTNGYIPVCQFSTKFGRLTTKQHLKRESSKQ